MTENGRDVIYTLSNEPLALVDFNALGSGS
jgi:hypothetical protein